MDAEEINEQTEEEIEEAAELVRKQEMHRERLSKKLAFILRYNALKEGLKVDDNGFVEMEELLAVPMLGHYSPEEIKEEIKNSQSHRGSCRYESHTENGKVLVRASYGRKMERNPNHDGTQVPTLLESSIRIILTNLKDYDLQDFPDDYLIGTMLHRLAKSKSLNNAALKILLVPAMEHLNLEDIFLTQNTLKMIYTQCPNLKSLSMRNCGYIVTDSVLSQLTKKLPKLEFLNLTGCSHLTDQGLRSIVKNLQHLARLGLSFNKGITEAGVIHLLQNAPALKLVDVFALKVSPEGRETIDKIRTERKIVVILKGLEEKDENGVSKHIKPTTLKGVM